MRLKITNTGMSGISARVEVDGEQRTDVMSVALNLDANGITTASMTFVVESLDLDVLAEPA